MRGSTVFWAVIALLASSLLQYVDFARWPGNPDGDVHLSIFAADNLVTTGKLQGIELYPDPNDDLAKHAEVRWMTHWPPMHSLFYAAAMMSGLSAGASTKALALLSVVVGGLGWVFLLRTLRAPPISLFSVAIAYPWLSFLARIYLDYKNDHWACAIAPWIYLAIIQTPPLKQSKSDNVGEIVGTGLLTGVGITMKYSMMPFLISSILYFVWLDGLDVCQARIKRMLFFSGAVIVPGTVLFILNLALADVAYPVSSGIGPEISLVSLTHFLTNTFAYPVGLDFLLTQLDMALASKLGLKLLKGTLLLTTVAVLVVWILFSRRSTIEKKQKRLVALLLILTITLWIFLVIVTVVDGRGHNYVSNTRVYIPVGLGWLAVCCVLLSNASKKDALWGAALATILIPILFSFVFFFIRGATGEAFAAMPRSMTAWIEYDPAQDGKLARQDMEHASFLANLVKRRGKVPDLFVAPEGRFMTELRVPCFWTFIATRNDGHIYYSTKKMEVWAMVPLDEEDILVRKFGKAFSRERIDAPDGYPYVTYIFGYDPGSG